MAVFRFRELVYNFDKQENGDCSSLNKFYGRENQIAQFLLAGIAGLYRHLEHMQYMLKSILMVVLLQVCPSGHQRAFYSNLMLPHRISEKGLQKYML